MHNKLGKTKRQTLSAILKGSAEGQHAPTAFTTPSLHRTFLWIEWSILLIYFLLILTAFPKIFPFRQTIILLVTLGVCGVLSFIFPLKRPLWQRRAYILLDILVLLPSRAFTNGSLDLLLYLFLGKSCFLLKRPDAILTAIASGVAWVSCVAFQFSEDITLIPDRVEKLLADPQTLFIQQIIGEVGSHIAACTFVLLFGFIALAERRSRQKAIALAKEVETLATALERTRIAREIHDSLGHSLTTLDVQLELAQRLYKRDIHRAEDALNVAKTLASQSLADVRRAVSAMREEGFDLNGAIGILIEQFPLKIDVQASFPPLNLQTSHQIYCIIQEALTNAQKHSRATYITVRGDRIPGAILVEVTDNGVGFNSSSPPSGFGLQGMQERIQLLGGKICIESQPGKGTQIQARIPFVTRHRCST
ncbi:sensor histidine kinase [Lusitaniella coriacea LEGE 07157]|uniref:Oxygen sensor histidine kinase NreB n=1 Tax=Lusitaniella coriacea LEGE 07157 TaxID=945747 RepID=A0A8J7DXQ2_9CYAN|nr:sensor histidine kinase [Lusitaniella coriacea]MBE9117367.1 sensor histidine kinase [Lusitaniella coriacea LEGE 07157]